MTLAPSEVKQACTELAEDQTTRVVRLTVVLLGLVENRSASLDRMFLTFSKLSPPAIARGWRLVGPRRGLTSPLTVRILVVPAEGSRSG